MGNTNATHIQENYKICMVCHKKNILNTEFMVLSFSQTRDRTLIDSNGELARKLCLRCSKGHLLTIYGDKDYLIEGIKRINRKNASISEKSKLEEKIELLKRKVEELDKALASLQLLEKMMVAPSAPIETPIEGPIQIVEATMI